MDAGFLQHRIVTLAIRSYSFYSIPLTLFSFCINYAFLYGHYFIEWIVCVTAKRAWKWARWPIFQPQEISDIIYLCRAEQRKKKGMKEWKINMSTLAAVLSISKINNRFGVSVSAFSFAIYTTKLYVLFYCRDDGLLLFLNEWKNHRLSTEIETHWASNKIHLESSEESLFDDGFIECRCVCVCVYNFNCLKAIQ